MEKLFELKKDINTPDMYIRAGEVKTKKGWERLFPRAFALPPAKDDWFIALSNESHRLKKENDLAQKVVEEIFKKNGLRSITYKEAAVLAIFEYVKRTSKI